MAIIRPGTSPAGTLESAASFTVVEAQTRSTPRWGRVTWVVSEPEVTEPLAAMMALPCETSSAPVTVAASSGWALSRGMMAMGPEGVGAGSGAGEAAGAGAV